MARPTTFALLALCLSSASAFAPLSQPTNRAQTALMAQQDGGKKFAAAAVASAYLISGLVVGADAALAEAYPSSPAFGDASTVLAARSGGRSGGRAGSGTSARTGGSGREAYRSEKTSTSTTIVQPTVVQQAAPSPVVVAPSPGYGYGYDPTPGLGLSLGINAIGAIGGGMREARQEREIATSKAELEVAKQRERDMEQRLRMLEMNQRMAPVPQAAAPVPVQ